MGISTSKLDVHIPQSTNFSPLYEDSNKMKLPFHETKRPVNEDKSEKIVPISSKEWLQNCSTWGLKPWTAEMFTFKIDYLKDYHLVMPTSRQLTICHYCHQSLPSDQVAKIPKWFGYQQVHCDASTCKNSARICRQLYLATNNLAQPDLNEIALPFETPSGDKYLVLAYCLTTSSRHAPQIVVKINLLNKADNDPEKFIGRRFQDLFMFHKYHDKMDLLDKFKPQFDPDYPIEVKTQFEKVYKKLSHDLCG
jgi:hypothetical protein